MEHLSNNEIKLYCDGCSELTDKFYTDYHYNLCYDCNEKYNDETGYCSLNCCLGGQCDESC